MGAVSQYYALEITKADRARNDALIHQAWKGGYSNVEASEAGGYECDINDKACRKWRQYVAQGGTDNLETFRQRSGILGYIETGIGILEGLIGRGRGEGVPADTPPADYVYESRGMSTGAKIGIAVGVVALGVAGYFLLRRKKR